MKTLIEITSYIDSRYYGAYLSATGWKQADIDNDPTHFAVLDEIPESNGQYWCELYEDGDEIEAVDTELEFDAIFSADIDGESTGTGSTTSDATEEIEFELSGETSIKNNHGRAIAKRLPTGMAWLGNTIKSLLKAIGFEFRRTELDFNERASIDNMLYGYNLDNWLSCAGLNPVSDKEEALNRKLTDKSGITPDDITNALHVAGFTDLYCYSNKFQIEHDYLECGDAEFGDDAEASGKIRFISVDPTTFKSEMPFYTFGDDTEAGDDLEAGSYNYHNYQFGDDAEFGDDVFAADPTTGGDLVVDDLENDYDEWDEIPENKSKWYKAFFICGDEIGKVVDIPENKRTELRKLIIERKPFKNYGILFINYTRS